MSPLPTDPSAPAEPVVICHTARFGARPATPSIAVVTAHGEIDAANTRQFVDYALDCAGAAVIVDLTGVEFFSTAGFSALHTLNVRCAGAGVDWTLVPSAAVSRLLRICDPDATLPCATDVDAAVAALREKARPLLQLVAQPR
ncbi:anti-sigma factor antagonist [Mycobacterium sp. PS03-16]|uniref:STAS domain-containing protein n=1 Tax=Mycobacterium sp. PS03-16 TaxID=2559611 RepID=UPI00107347BE|nr:STAS domain-containing protein [Mycobacterium sp. PS03-16]TFV58635.1 anti-sigma factor antagonist [Mycobacterium sp. PS03-16]